MKIALLGAGGHFKVVVDILRNCGHEIAFALDDNEKLHGSTVMGVEVVDGIEAISSRIHLVDGVFPAIGSESTRAKLLDLAERLSLKMPNAIHPFSAIADGVTMGSGIAIMAGAVINPATEVKDGAIINTSASVDHDCSIGRSAQVAPGAHLGGGVALDDEVLIGIGAVVMPGLSIGKGATVGCGAVVTKNVKAGQTVVGIPARPMQG